MQRALGGLQRRRPRAAMRVPAQHRGYAASSTTDARRPNIAPRPMLNIRHIRQNPALYEQTCVERNYPAQAGHAARIVALHEEWLRLQRSGRALRERSNLLRRALARPAAAAETCAKLSGEEAAAAMDSSDGGKTEDDLRSRSREELRAEARRLKTELAGIERGEAEAQAGIETLALELPNLTSADTPRGAEPRVLRYINERRSNGGGGGGGGNLSRTSHVEIGTELGILDLASAATTTGWGWYFLVGAGARLENALVQHALSVVAGDDGEWTPVAPPSVVYEHVGAACGFRPRDQHGEQQVYTLGESSSSSSSSSVDSDSDSNDTSSSPPQRVLAGTAEIPLAGMYASKTLDTALLPLRRVAVSRCYRAEAGARGSRARGLYRVHEFTKVEMFAWARAGPADDGDDDVDACDADATGGRDRGGAHALFDEMVALQTEILARLGIPCRVLAMPAADLGASAAKKIDIEAWFPGRGEGGGWGEVTSASLCTDYQSRRLVTRARPGGHAAGGSGGGGASSSSSLLEFPWTLNGTALAVPRVLAALLENGWDETTRTVTIPECLRPWMGGQDKIGPAAQKRR